MKKYTLPLFILVFFFTLVNPSKSKAQMVDLLGGNLLNGAVTGSLLGVGVMGLQNSNDFAPLRIGLGAGILGGAGIAFYDITTHPQGQQFFISGLFNDGNNSSVIILLDTIYGVGAGAVIGTAVMLIQNKPIVQGLQYGGGAGAWVGFGLGIADAFTFSERNRDFMADKILNRSSLIQGKAGHFEIGFGEPVFYQTLNNSLNYEFHPGVKLVSVSSNF